VNNSVRKASVTLLFYLQTRYELCCCVCFYQSALCRLCVFVLYALSRVFAEGNVRYPVCTCRSPIFNSRDPNRVPKTLQQNPGLSVCYKTLILNKFTKRYICFTTYLKGGREPKVNYFGGGVMEKRLRTTAIDYVRKSI